MSQFFLSNPTLQEDLKFESPPEIEPIKKTDFIESKTPFSHKKEDEKKEKTQDFSNYWGTLSKEIMRNTHKGVKMPPSLESVNNRLNIFRAKIEKIDHLELLAKESAEKKTNKAKEQSKKIQKNNESNDIKLPEEELEIKDEEDDVVYYSFKKTMQLKLHKRKELERLEQEKKEKLRKKNELLGNSSLETNASNTNKKNLPFHERYLKDKGQDKQKELVKDEKALEFQSVIGQELYQLLKQSGDDVELFRKRASEQLKKHNKTVKEQLYKNRYKNFPPQIPKFTAEETKNLNILLPDYNAAMFIQNKNNLFNNLEDVKPQINSPEYEMVKTINKIIDGKIIGFWKSCQNT